MSNKNKKILKEFVDIAEQKANQEEPLKIQTIDDYLAELGYNPEDFKKNIEAFPRLFYTKPKSKDDIGSIEKHIENDPNIMLYTALILAKKN
jgi:hypothetical protein